MGDEQLKMKDINIGNDDERIEDLQKHLNAAKEEIKAYKKFVEKFRENPCDLSLPHHAECLLNGSYGALSDLTDSSTSHELISNSSSLNTENSSSNLMKNENNTIIYEQEVLDKKRKVDIEEKVNIASENKTMNNSPKMCVIN